MTGSTPSDNRLLRLNVGFLLKEGAGYARDVVFDHPGTIRVEDVLIERLNGSLHLSRTPQGVLVQGTLHAHTPAECVRCLKPFEQPFSIELSELFVPFGQAFSLEDDEDHRFTIDEGNYIDLTPIMREEGILGIPIQSLCSPECKGLCPVCGQDLNEGTCTCQRDTFDPRLAALRALLEE